MTATVKSSVAILALLCVASPSYATPCASSIVRVQAKVDAAIEKRAGADNWKSESLDATLNHQRIPFLLAATEGPPGRSLQVALESLDRARAADSVGYIAVCRQQVAAARAVLRRQRH